MLYCLLLSTVSVEQEVIRIASKTDSNLFIFSLFLKRLNIYTDFFKDIKKGQEEQLSIEEDNKKSKIKEIDDLDNQKDWIDWVTKYSKDISMSVILRSMIKKANKTVEIDLI